MSSQRAALIAAILETPEDDAPRLVCADWFEEQGDPANVARADFIRTQLCRARLPEDDPQQAALEAHELRLLKRWSAVWCGSHFVFKKCRFRRGFIEYVHLRLQHFLHHRRQMLALEPVRDVSLTGWIWASGDLVRRVARCPEWKQIETLRLHHQGPHKSPRSNVLLLLESPHLTGLRRLICPRLQFDADARRRFERLDVLRRLRELRLPPFETYPVNPGEWLSDGGAEHAEQWRELRSLALSYNLTLDLLRRLVELPFWRRLESFELSPSRQINEMLALVSDRLPTTLTRLHLRGGYGGVDPAAARAFLERLGQAPLQSVSLEGMFTDAAGLERCLSGTNRWNLHHLRLRSNLDEEQARLIADSPGTQKLTSLSLVEGDATLRGLFTSGRLNSLVRLDLSGSSRQAAMALAAADGWGGLRTLNLAEVELGQEGLRTLAASPNLQRLTRLAVGGDYCERALLADVPPDLAAALSRLPHLADLRLRSHRCDPKTREVFAGFPGWVAIDTTEDYEGDAQRYRALRTAGRFPPLDDPWKQ
jgi:uncharacterized protein (TIGR02996 family)